MPFQLHYSPIEDRTNNESLIAHLTLRSSICIWVSTDSSFLALDSWTRNWWTSLNWWPISYNPTCQHVCPFLCLRKSCDLVSAKWRRALPGTDSTYIVTKPSQASMFGPLIQTLQLKLQGCSPKTVLLRYALQEHTTGLKPMGRGAYVKSQDHSRWWVSMTGNKVIANFLPSSPLMHHSMVKLQCRKPWFAITKRSHGECLSEVIPSLPALLPPPPLKKTSSWIWLEETRVLNKAVLLVCE